MKKMILFLAIFTICAISVTGVMIKYKQNEVEITNQNETELIESKINNEDGAKYTGIDIYDTYDENDLLINEEKEVFNGKEIPIVQIEGLKDKEIENKINEDIKNRIHEYVLENPLKASDESYKFWINANFGNAISVEYYFYKKYYGYDTARSLVLNYNLVNGERLKYEDLFTADADILGISREIVYKDYSDAADGELEYNNATESELEKVIQDKKWLADDFERLDENKIYKIVKGFIQEKDKKFLFSHSCIEFVYDDRSYYIDIGSYLSSIGIYNNLKTQDSIFEKDNIGRKNLLVLSELNPFDFEDVKEKRGLLEFECGLLEDNLWYDNIISDDGITYLNENVESNYRRLIKDEKIYQENFVKDYQELARKNKDKFYILTNMTMISSEYFSQSRGGLLKYTDLNCVGRRLYACEIPIELYEKVYKEKLYDLHRHCYFGSFSYKAPLSVEDDSMVNLKTIEKNYLIKLDNYKVISQLEDLVEINEKFYDLIRDKVLNDTHYKIDENQLEDFMKNVKYSPKIDGLRYEFIFESEGFDGRYHLSIRDLQEFLLIVEVERDNE